MFRVLDTMLSAHSRLRDRYRRRIKVLTLAILLLSLAATALAFLTGDRNLNVGGRFVRLQIIVGALTLMIFALSLLELVVGWSRKAWMHEDAASRLGQLKLRFRGAKHVEDGYEVEGHDLANEYQATMDAIVEIPDDQFIPMKAQHRRKIELSKLLDAYPGVPVPLLRLVLWWRDWRRLLESGGFVSREDVERRARLSEGERVEADQGFGANGDPVPEPRNLND